MRRDGSRVDAATSMAEDSRSLLTKAWSLISCSLLNPLFVDNSISCQRKQCWEQLLWPACQFHFGEAGFGEERGGWGQGSVEAHSCRLLHHLHLLLEVRAAVGVTEGAVPPSIHLSAKGRAERRWTDRESAALPHVIHTCNESSFSVANSAALFNFTSGRGAAGPRDDSPPGPHLSPSYRLSTVTLTLLTL